MPAAAIGAVGVIGGALISSKATKSAGSTAANATRQASQDLIKETQAARADVLDRMVPALKDYGNEIDNLQQYIADGTADVMRVLAGTTSNAMRIIKQTGADARKALLGSTATASGIPRRQFDQQFSQIMQLPPEQQDAAFQQVMPQAYSTFVSQRLMGDTGDRSTGQTSAATSGSIPSTYRGSQRDLDRGYNPFEGRLGFNTKSALASTANSNSKRTVYQAATPGTPAQYEYSGYQDRGTPGVYANVSGLGAGAISPHGAAPGTGFYGAMEQLQGGENRSLAALAGGTGIARRDIITGRDAALDNLQPYSSAGRSALGVEAALSGALGPEAQQEAINNYIESPGQEFLRGRMEQSLLRNASATGGLGGGRVLTALQEQAMGIASTQQQQHLENLRSLAQRGQQADTGAAEINMSAASQLAGLAERLGVRGADLVNMNAQQKAALAERVGIQLSDLDKAIGAAQAGALSQLGGQLSSTLAAGIGDVASLGERAAGTQLQAQQGISQLGANLATQTATNVADLTTAGGSALAVSQNQAGATMGQMFQDLGKIGSYAVNSQPTQPSSLALNVSGYYPGTVAPNGAHIGTTQNTAYGM
jgi:hypothetical protein